MGCDVITTVYWWFAGMVVMTRTQRRTGMILSNLTHHSSVISNNPPTISMAASVLQGVFALHVTHAPHDVRRMTLCMTSLCCSPTSPGSPRQLQASPPTSPQHHSPPVRPAPPLEVDNTSSLEVRLTPLPLSPFCTKFP